MEAEPSASGANLDELFRAQRARLWGLAYRLTGCAAEADDIVQEAFSRLLARPAPRAGDGQAPWLVRVVTNLGIDTLRARRRRPYAGPWLPEPSTLELDAADGVLGEARADPETRVELAESATFAFLVALEALGPRQRAALLLRDAFGYSADETAAILGTSAGNVRQLHLRARRAMQEYDRSRCAPTADVRARHRTAVERLLGALAAQDARSLEALLAESARTLTDAAGEYTALATPLVGRSRVARLYLRAAAERAAGDATFTLCSLNGLPAVLIALGRPVRRQAPRTAMLLDTAEDGRIRTIYTVLASRKLAALPFPDARSAPV